MTAPSPVLPFYCAPGPNALRLAEEIALHCDTTRRPNADILTRLVNRSTLELYRGWRWYDALVTNERYADLLQSGAVDVDDDPQHFGSITLNLGRLLAAAGRFDNADVSLRRLLDQPAAAPPVAREAVNAAVLSGSTRAARRLLDELSPHPALATARQHLDLLDDLDVRIETPVGLPVDGSTTWHLEVALLQAIRNRDSWRTQVLARRLSRAALAAGSTGSPYLAALERCGRTAHTWGWRFATAKIGGMLRADGDRTERAVTAVRGITLQLLGEDHVPDLLNVVSGSPALGCPRDLVRLWSAVVEGSADVRSVQHARALLAHVSLDPSPVDCAAAAVEGAGVVAPVDNLGSDGLRPETRSSLSALFVALLAVLDRAT